ncbi:protein BFR2 [Scheffersomyces coipomensis]|uniref:protein BFR2 n=1 Tax=Scheffersomyces coipomensis TaxID=1788519 RepID=UPI00315CE1F3
MAKKSLAEQLAEFTKPQTDFDIENSELKDDVFEDGSDNEINSDFSDDETLRKEHYVASSKSKIRKENESIELGGKYSGSVTSRDRLYDDDEEDDEDEEEDDEEEEDEEEEEEQDDDDDNNDINEESDSGVSLSNESSDDEEDDESDKEDEELGVKRDKIKEFMAKEGVHIVNRLSQSATNDSLKGYAISQQHKFFDKIIDSRLKIQKSVINSNLLPPNSDIFISQDLKTKHSEKYLQEAKNECFELLDTILSLRKAMYKRDNVTTESIVKKPKKRTFQEYSNTTNALDLKLNKYRSNVLVKWSAKVQNSSGSSAINAGKFKFINQSFEEQVKNNLSDMDRLVKRTKLNRRKVVPLGYEYYQQQKQDNGENNDQEDDDEDVNPDLPKNSNNESKEQALGEIDEIFDDEDFYRVLLNDLVDKKIQSSNPAAGMTLSIRSAQKAQKFKKNVDTKASKGRKLKYQVQEQIANFESSKRNWKWDDNQIDEFFASLLGQKVNMNEIDEEEEQDQVQNGDNGSDYDDIVAGEDSIKLFG